MKAKNKYISVLEDKIKKLNIQNRLLEESNGILKKILENSEICQGKEEIIQKIDMIEKDIKTITKSINSQRPIYYKNRGYLIFLTLSNAIICLLLLIKYLGN